MKIEQFAGKILKEVKDKADGDFNVQLTKAAKNNGIKLTVISASKPGTEGGPCVYLDDYYEMYMDGAVGISEAAMDVYQRLVGHIDGLCGIDLSSFCQWDKTKDYIYAKLVNAEMNRELLASIPHRKFLDLAVVYYARVEGIREDEGTASILIYNSHMGMWEAEEENLYHAAVKNMRTDGEPLFEDMGTILRGAVPEGMGCTEDMPVPSGGFYVLTNRRKIFGAAELLDGDTLKAIGDKLGDDFIVLPSSIHESIILPADGAPPYAELAAIVRGINETQVGIEERLSDRVYIYGRNEGVLKVAV